MPAVTAQAQLKALIERIERLDEEKRAIADDIKEVYAEAKGTGYDVKALRAIVRLRKMDADERREQEAILETYMAALGMLPGAEVDEERLKPKRKRSGAGKACRSRSQAAGEFITGPAADRSSRRAGDRSGGRRRDSRWDKPMGPGCRPPSSPARPAASLGGRPPRRRPPAGDAADHSHRAGVSRPRLAAVQRHAPGGAARVSFRRARSSAWPQAP